MTDPSEYERLIRTITAPELALGLMLARYEHAILGRQTWERAAAEAKAAGRRVAVLDLGDAEDDADILGRLSQASAGADQPDLLFVVNLERLLVGPGGQPRATPAIAAFNFSRDLLPARVGKPIVLWMSYRAARAFALRARDTFDVVQATFEFPETLAATSLRPTHDTLPSWMEHAPLGERSQLEDRRHVLEGLYEEASPESAQAGDLAASVARIEFALGHHADGLAWSERAIRALEACGDLEGAARQHERRGYMHVALGEFDSATRASERALTLAREAGNTSAELDALHLRVDILQRRGALDEALRTLRELVLPAEQDDWRRAQAMSSVAWILRRRGELDEALMILREVLPIFETRGDTRKCAITVAEIADILRSQGELDEALRILVEEALPTFEALGDIRSRALVWNMVASIHHDRGEFDEALRVRRREVLPTFQRLGDVHSQAGAKHNMALTMLERGHLDEDGVEICELLFDAWQRARELGLTDAPAFKATLMRALDEIPPLTS